jgi:hypothetical protein
MSRKRHLYGTAAAVLVGGFLLSGSVAFAQQPQQPQIPGVSVTWNQARDAALGAVPGTVVEQEMEFRGGRVAYEVEILPQGGGMKREVLIDASNAAVLSNRVDFAAAASLLGPTARSLPPPGQQARSRWIVIVENERRLARVRGRGLQEHGHAPRSVRWGRSWPWWRPPEPESRPHARSDCRTSAEP